MRVATHSFLVLLPLVLLAGCGGAGGHGNTVARASSTPRAPLPALATRPAAPGEIVARGETSPRTHGPYVFDGRYLVRFAQYAPEDASIDFRSQTPFSATLTPRRDDPRGAKKLISAAAATGHTELELHGRYFLSVDFGDFPYVVRFTPHSG